MFTIKKTSIVGGLENPPSQRRAIHKWRGEDGMCNTHSNTKKSSSRTSIRKEDFKKTAATYSPALRRSTIGAHGLNFSVRDGKRWNPTAITA